VGGCAGGGEGRWGSFGKRGFGMEEGQVAGGEALVQ
jgi:hypothetical protein